MAVAQNRLRALFSAKQEGLLARFKEVRAASKHPGAIGDAFESAWKEFLREVLPGRYFVEKGFVYDSRGAITEEIDILIVDRQYSPLFMRESGRLIVPSESVYAALEVKPQVNKANLDYAAKIAASVRKLYRTSEPIPTNVEVCKPKGCTHILSGLIAGSCKWKPTFGTTFLRAFERTDELEQLDFAMALDKGCHWMKRRYVEQEMGYSMETEIEEFSNELALFGFAMRICDQLRLVGTVPAISFDAYLAAAQVD